jgi:hypothetical protein
LARNTGSEPAEAEKIIANIITGQYQDRAEQWFSNSKQEPEGPYVGSPNYPANIYGSLTQTIAGLWAILITAVEDFLHPLSTGT